MKLIITILMPLSLFILPSCAHKTTHNLSSTTINDDTWYMVLPSTRIETCVDVNCRQKDFLLAYDHFKKIQEIGNFFKIITYDGRLYHFPKSYLNESNFQITHSIPKIEISWTHQEQVECRNFPSQTVAQAYYLSNKLEYGVLDGDNDGIACESLNHNDYQEDSPYSKSTVTAMHGSTCYKFQSQVEAQRLYDSAPNAYQFLDKDKDGKACEDYEEYFSRKKTRNGSISVTYGTTGSTRVKSHYRTSKNGKRYKVKSHTRRRRRK